jgi:tetratricopeptide (TPR) repeat protein
MALDLTRTDALALLLLIGLAVATPVRAQQISEPPRRAADAHDAAFAEMMMRPADPAAAVRYARLAAARGDARVAIPALERVLRLDPSLDNIRLELASLHLATGSPDLAATYARQALQSPQIPPEVAERARQLLAQAERASARSTFDVNLFAGLRHDTNANQATALATVPIFDPGLQDVVNIPAPDRGRSDWSVVLGARAQHRVDLGLQREGTWETNAAAFEQRFARIPRGYDLTILSADTGPRLGVAEFADGAARLSLRPFATAGWLGYGWDTYAWLYGGGVTAELRLPPRWTAELSWIGRFGNYERSSFRPSARAYTGFDSTVAASLSYDLSPVTRLTGTLAYTDAGARQDWNAREALGGSLGASTVLTLAEGWQIGLAGRAGVREVRYDAPDPFIDITRRRDDTRWEAGASLVLPLTSNLALVAEYDWFDQRSNYALYRYRNHAVTLGLRIGL